MERDSNTKSFKMKSSEIKMLEEEDFLHYDCWNDYYYQDDDYFHSEFSKVDYSIDENGLVDWSIEIPVSIKRLNRIEIILNQEIDLSNKIGHFWPK